MMFISWPSHFMSPCCGHAPGHGHALGFVKAQGCGQFPGHGQAQGCGHTPGCGQALGHFFNFLSEYFGLYP